MSKKKLIIALITIIQTLSGCNLSGSSGTPPQIFPTMTSLDRPTPTETNPSLPTASITPSISPQRTPTPLPDINAEGVFDSLLGFFQENGECELPCQLGLTPSISGSVEVSHFLSYFGDVAIALDGQGEDVFINMGSNHDPSHRSGVLLTFERKDISVYIYEDIHYDDNGLVTQSSLLGDVYREDNDGSWMIYGNPFLDVVMEHFTIVNLLNTYGPPDQVLIRSFPEDPRRPSPPASYAFNFILLYSGRGFLVEYRTERQKQGDYYLGCPTIPHSIQTSSWDPNNPISLGNAVRFFDGGASASNVKFYRPIEDVTSLDVAGFHELFARSAIDTCVQTKRELWPTLP